MSIRAWLEQQTVARAYPKIRVDGYNLDTAAIETARVNAKDGSLEDRFSFITAMPVIHR